MTAAHYDVVVVGGGINGAGVAQAAAAAGYTALVLERHALAAGTSSKSSKLIHGGLRYLESYQFGLVRESLRERALLLARAPDLVQLQDFLIPVYADSRRSPALIRAGLSLYYLLSGLDSRARFATLPKRQWKQLDGLRTDGLRAVFRYTDARTDDALLTEAVMRSAEALGAELVCPAKFCGAELHADGCEVRYRVGTWERACNATVLVNASGPWAAENAALITPAPPAVEVELVQGTHIEMPLHLTGISQRYFYYVESPRDGRAIFLMPRGERLIVGTTETRFRNHPDRVQPLAAEESYLLGVLRHYFPGLTGLNRDALLGSWAGLRVLPGGEGHAFHRSRESLLQTDRAGRPRVVTIYGGKLTTYRATAAHVLQRIAASLPVRAPVADTATLPLHAG